MSSSDVVKLIKEKEVKWAAIGQAWRQVVRNRDALNWLLIAPD
jgi:hypothetical protein